MELTIRPLATIAEYREAEALQRAVWGLDDLEVVPDHVLLTAQKNGGLALGAWAPDQGGARLVGLVFGFLGLARDGRLKHCSHLAGVLPDLQGQQVGRQLKLAQRERVLGQGVGLITWTYDPLESRNAALNIGRLGAVCRTYHRDLYGGMRDSLNTGLPSDRFEVEWHLTSPHVERRLAGAPRPALAQLRAEGLAPLNRVAPGPLPRPEEPAGPIAGERLLIAIPPGFQAIKAADMPLARAWRAQTRALFEAAFAAGYTVTDLLHEAGESCYLLERGFSPG